MIDLRLRLLYIRFGGLESAVFSMLNGDSALLCEMIHGRGARASAIRFRRGKTYFAQMIHGPRSIFSFSLSVNNGSHLRRHEELPQLRGLRSPLFLLGEKMIAHRFDDARVVLPEPFCYLPVPELCLFVICELLVILCTWRREYFW
jgi:hypothetical protein